MALPLHRYLRLPDRIPRGKQCNRGYQHDVIDEAGFRVEAIEHDGAQRDDLRNERHRAAAASPEFPCGEFSEEQRDWG